MEKILKFAYGLYAFTAALCLCGAGVHFGLEAVAYAVITMAVGAFWAHFETERIYIRDYLRDEDEEEVRYGSR